MSNPVDIPAMLAQGGETATALLQFSIRSIQLEPLFYVLAKEYQQRCTHQSALVLYDLFLAPNAPARLSVAHVLPPQDLRLSALITHLRQQYAQMQSPQPPDEEKRLHIAQPQRSLFDNITAALPARFAAIGSQFDPAKRVNECLPGGALTAGQRHFINQVWLAQVRPKLVAAGFWKVASLE